MENTNANRESQDHLYLTVTIPMLQDKLMTESGVDKSLNKDFVYAQWISRKFMDEFNASPFEKKLTLLIQFIEVHNKYVAKILSETNSFDKTYRDVSDTIFMFTAKAFENFFNEIKSNKDKIKLVFSERPESGYGKTVWEEYEYILVNNAKWNMTSDAKGLWAMNIVLFGQLKSKFETPGQITGKEELLDILNPKSNNENSGKKRNEGCFIATHAYGDYDHPKVLLLRSFRDNVLRKNYIKRAFIKLYYLTSPKIVLLFKNNKGFVGISFFPQ